MTECQAKVPTAFSKTLFLSSFVSSILAPEHLVTFPDARNRIHITFVSFSILRRKEMLTPKHETIHTRNRKHLTVFWRCPVFLTNGWNTTCVQAIALTTHKKATLALWVASVHADMTQVQIGPLSFRVIRLMMTIIDHPHPSPHQTKAHNGNRRSLRHHSCDRTMFAICRKRLANYDFVSSCTVEPFYHTVASDVNITPRHFLCIWYSFERAHCCRWKTYLWSDLWQKE